MLDQQEARAEPTTDCSTTHPCCCEMRRPLHLFNTSPVQLSLLLGGQQEAQSSRRRVSDEPMPQRQSRSRRGYAARR